MKKIEGPIRVLLLTEFLLRGGAERVITELVQALDKNKVLITVCLYRDIGPFAIDLQKAGYYVMFLRKEILTRFSPRFLRPIFLLLESIIFVIRLVIFIRKNNFQIIHSHMPSGNLWGILATFALSWWWRPGIITTEHTIRGWEKSIKHTIVNRIVTLLSDKIVAVSNQVADSIEKQKIIASNKLIVIPNGVCIEDDIKRQKKTGLRPKPKDIPDKQPLIAIIGRLEGVKRHDLFLKAVRICKERLPDISGLIIGEGPDREDLEQLAKKLNLSDNVFFLGERGDIRELLHHLYLVVSTSDYEGLAMNLLEAMATGLPVVATDAGGTSELIQSEKTGILVEVGNVNAIADGICKLIENPEMAKKIGLAGQEKVINSYSMKKIALKWENLYKEVFVERNSKHC